MTSTGTYSFGPAASSLTLVAYSRIGIKRAAITTQHLTDADLESNLLQVEFSSRVPNLWLQEVSTQILTSGTAAYTLPARTIGVRDIYMTTTVSSSDTFGRVLFPMSAITYDAQPNKTLQSPPQSYYVQKTITPTITTWPVADDNATYTLNMRLMIQPQDVSQASGATLDMPYRFLDVYCAGLAYRLARSYAPDKEQLRKQDYMDAWANAASEDVEDNVSISIAPTIGAYYRG